MGARRSAALLALLVAAPAATVVADPNPWTLEGRAAVARARKLRPEEGRARNVILFLGDGMGLTTITAARILEGQLRGESGEENLLSFEKLPHLALVKTYNTNQQTPDSAGTMTAIVTGVKTRAGVLSLDEAVPRGDHRGLKGHRLRTLFEEAEQRGAATGIVTTTSVTHATPAACYAHAPERNWENDTSLPLAARLAGFPDIARQLVEFPHGDGIDVVLGGGRAHFLPAGNGAAKPEDAARRGKRGDGRDLIAEWKERGQRSRYVSNRDQLQRIKPDEKHQVLGLFAPSHLQFEFERQRQAPSQPSLSELTAAAINLLAVGPKGFVLMIEGGRIDHGHHLGNAYRALTETIEFARAVEVARELTDPDETLIVVTADHGHVLTFGGYPTRGNPILGKVITNDLSGESMQAFAEDALGRPYTTLGYQNGPGYTGASDKLPEGPKRVTPPPRDVHGIEHGRPDVSGVDTGRADYLQEATVPMVSETHSGEDVPVYAGGPGSHLFHGVQEQSYLYHAIVEALGWNDAGQQKKN